MQDAVAPINPDYNFGAEAGVDCAEVPPLGGTGCRSPDKPRLQLRGGGGGRLRGDPTGRRGGMQDMRYRDASPIWYNLSNYDSRNTLVLPSFLCSALERIGSAPSRCGAS